MLDLGIVETFNGIKAHPSDTKILDDAKIEIGEYKLMVNNYYELV